MDKRHIQSTGGSSFAITLPKKWVEENHLKEKDLLLFSERKSGTLILYPQKSPKPKNISIEGLNHNAVHRLLIALYMLGENEIRISAKNINTQTRRAIRNTLQKLIGFETLEETSTELILKSVLDPDRFRFEPHVERMLATAEVLLRESIEAFLIDDQTTASDLVDRDFEVDKVYFLISRMYNSLISDKVTEETLNCNLMSADYFHSIAQQLERIADHATKIAHVVGRDDLHKTVKVQKLLEKIAQSIYSLLLEARQFTKAPNHLAANNVLDSIQRSKEENEILYKEIIRSNFISAIIVNDSLERCKDYIGNMAELAISRSIQNDLK
jgi:phosphate uptake regulator